MVKIKNYSQENLDFIRNNYQNMTIKQMANELNKSRDSVTYAVRMLNLTKQVHKPWTEQENSFLKENYLTMTNTHIAKTLGRTSPSVAAQMDRLNLFRSNPWTDDEVQYLCSNYKTQTYEEIGCALNRTSRAVEAKCHDLKLYKKELPWTEEDLKFVKDNYMKMSTSDIGKILNRSKDAVQIKAHKMGLKKYPYTCDYHYFENIDTEEKAYWLGFLMADGWISKNEKTNSAAVGIELQYGDIGHLKKFNKSISGNYMISDRWRKCELSNKNDKLKHSCVIRIYSTIMYKDLVDLGFTRNKSFDCGIPEIRSDLLRHFIRGYFDGNGRLSYTKSAFSVGFVTASKCFNQDLINIVEHLGLFLSKCSHINEFGTVVYEPCFTRKKDKILFLDWIYKDSTVYLDRKYKKYLKAKEKYGSSIGLAS